MKRLAGVALTLLFACTGAAASHGEKQHEDRAGAGWPVDAFTLVDQQGIAFDQQRLAGRWTFLLFGDTHCESPCTAALDALAGLFRRIGSTDAVRTTQAIFVSLDPARDTPAALGRFLAPYEAAARTKSAPDRTTTCFTGATGQPAALQRLADDLRALDDSAATAGGPKYRGSMLLVGPDGAVRTEFLPPFDVKRLTSAFLLVRARR
jgi:protein SCO1/2